MATPFEWLQGARPRTLPAAVAPVAAGSGAAATVDGFRVGYAVLALVVAVALQVGVNYANDYSDGIRGTDADRVGPLRLVWSGVAAATAVRNAAVACFAVATAAGVVLCAVSSWWLLVVGAAAIAAAWFYTGGARPYGYRALGELSVFVFFGLVAVLGTTYVQAGRVTAVAMAGAVAVGALACAILVANNLRDVPTDRVAGKRTLAVVLGEHRSRLLYLALVALPYLVALGLVAATPWALLSLASLPLALRAARRVRAQAIGSALVPVLRDTGLSELAYALVLALGLGLGS